MKRPGQLLVISDDDMRSAWVDALAHSGHLVEVAPDLATALSSLERGAPDLVVVDQPLAGPGFEVLTQIRKLAPSVALLQLVSEDGASDIDEAVTCGADHCLTKPVNIPALMALAARALQKQIVARQAAEASTRTSERLERGNFERIVGAHPLMQQMLNKVFHAAQSRATVLIHGETGTGKELIAAAIHQNSKRADGPFIRLNCAALADSVLESELFGHEKGAFTGAANRRRGRFEQAHLGTLFLDEVSEIPASVQVKLLRFLQEREFERVGGEDTVQVDVRVVAATNRDLKSKVSDGTFREDLYYRLNVVRVEVPPLRARPSDVLPLAEHFMQRFAEENDKHIRGFSDTARDALLAYPWPGNVRELQNIVEQAVVLCETDEIAAIDLPLSADFTADAPVKLMIPGTTLAELERYAILKTLEAVGGSPGRTAEILGVSRRTIQYRLREWGIKAREMKGEPSSPSDPSFDDDDDGEPASERELPSSAD